MYLLTDDQTIDDLRIFGKGDTAGIYDLYNNTHTRGAEMVLSSMFRQPLSNKEEINRRSGIIAELARLQISFPFDVALFDTTEKYLSAEQPHQSAVLSEKDISNGVHAVVDLFQHIREFINKPAIKNIHGLQTEREGIEAVLSDAVFEPALREGKSKLPYAAVTAYDQLFRLRGKSKIETLLGILYYLDVYISVAGIATKRDFVFPTARNKGQSYLKLDGVYHPELVAPVSNDIIMDSGSNLIFLTGANMAGKSTFLRSLSTALYIAHMGFPVAARSMEFSVMDGIYTTINLPDNLGIGASHFYAEVLRVKKVAAELHAGKSLFIIFDEMFRGTNVKDAWEATVEVSQAFARKSNSLFIISSHIVEAGERLQRSPSISFRYLPTRMQGHSPEYTYKLEQGITGDRHGMIIIRNEGIIDILGNGKKNSMTVNNSFSIDRQTLDELNLLGKFRQGSVYHLFNQVRTRGGEQILDGMFREPLTDANAINHRSSLFRQFQEAGLSFPFDVQQLTHMREYLDTPATGHIMAVMTGTLLKKILSSLTRDERYKKNVQGLQAIIVTLNRCHTMLETMPAMKGPFADRTRTIRSILDIPQLVKLRSIDIYSTLPVKTIAFYNHLLKKRFAQEMEEILQFIHELDVNIAVSDLAKNKNFNYAKALPPDRTILQAQELVHPCIQGAIGNNIEMDEASNVIFLTGANMAGKSTLMKSIGINIYLAHMGFPVAAGRLEFSVREGLYTSINVADNIALGYSHFYAEVVRVRQAAEAVAGGKRLLLMFDELFKGTNVKDAYDGTLAVTEGFAAYQQCLFIVSTHIIEVGEALGKRKNIQFVFMPTVMDGVKPTYTYRLQQGITEDRQGMMIVRNEGILELLK